MFLDKTIELDKAKVPQMLQEDFSALEDFYDKDQINFHIINTIKLFNKERKCINN